MECALFCSLTMMPVSRIVPIPTARPDRMCWSRLTRAAQSAPTAMSPVTGSSAASAAIRRGLPDEQGQDRCHHGKSLQQRREDPPHGLLERPSLVEQDVEGQALALPPRSLRAQSPRQGDEVRGPRAVHADHHDLPAIHPADALPFAKAMLHGCNRPQGQVPAPGQPEGKSGELPCCAHPPGNRAHSSAAGRRQRACRDENGLAGDLPGDVGEGEAVEPGPAGIHTHVDLAGGAPACLDLPCAGDPGEARLDFPLDPVAQLFPASPCGPDTRDEDRPLAERTGEDFGLLRRGGQPLSHPLHRVAQGSRQSGPPFLPGGDHGHARPAVLGDRPHLHHAGDDGEGVLEGHRHRAFDPPARPPPRPRS